MIRVNDTMRSRYSTAVLAILFLCLLFHLGTFAQDEKHEIVPGADFQHPIYLALDEGKKENLVQGIGDNSKRPAIVYIVRLEAGQKLSAKLTSTFDKSRGQEPFVLYLFDGKTTSLVGSGTTWIVRQPGMSESKEKSKKEPEPTEKPTLFSASFDFASPVTDDYYVVPIFQSAGLVYTLAANVTRVADLPQPLSCVSGRLTKPTYVSPGVANSVISDITVGDRAKADKPDEHNRRFCVAQVCKIRPPTSLVLTIRLQEAYEAKKEVKVCWDSLNTITELSVGP